MCSLDRPSCMRRCGLGERVWTLKNEKVSRFAPGPRCIAYCAPIREMAPSLNKDHVLISGCGNRGRFGRPPGTHLEKSNGCLNRTAGDIDMAEQYYAQICWNSNG